MRVGFPALLAAMLAFVLAPSAAAHVGRPVLPDAVAALQTGSVYVDYDASPTLTHLEADRLRRSLPGRVHVAILPAKVRQEVSGDVARTLAENVGRSGAYLVVIGGELTVIDAPATAAQAFEQHRGEGLGPAVDAAAIAASQSSDGANWPAFVVSTLLGLVALAFLAYRSREARQRTSVRD
jgi:hypothetical protein